MKKRTRNIIGISIIVAVLATLIAASIVKSYKYYYTVDELFGLGKDSLRHDLKVAGTVRKGSITTKKGEPGCAFVLYGEKREINVYYRGQVPDSFREEIPVVVEGKMDGDLNFKANLLLTKCASKYEEKL